LKFHTGIREYFTRGDGRYTNEHRLDPYLAADSDVSEARTGGAQEAGKLAARHVGRFNGDRVPQEHSVRVHDGKRDDGACQSNCCRRQVRSRTDREDT